MRVRHLDESRAPATRGCDGRSRARRTRFRAEVVGLEDRRLLSGAGTLDTSFGSGGIQQLYITNFTGSSPYQSADAVAVDSSSNVVAAGFTDPSSSSSGPVSASVVRLTSSGAPTSISARRGRWSSPAAPVR